MNNRSGNSENLLKNVNYDNYVNGVLSLPRGVMRLVPITIVAGSKQPVSLKGEDLSVINKVFQDAFTVCRKTGKNSYYSSLDVKRRGVKHMLNSSFAVIDLETYSDLDGIQKVYCIGAVAFDVNTGKFNSKS